MVVIVMIIAWFMMTMKMMIMIMTRVQIGCDDDIRIIMMIIKTK